MKIATPRGQPLVAIVSLLVGYTVLRTAFWSPLLEAIPLPATAPIETLSGPVAASQVFVPGSEATVAALHADPILARLIKIERTAPPVALAPITLTKATDEEPNGLGPRSSWSPSGDEQSLVKREGAPSADASLEPRFGSAAEPAAAAPRSAFGRRFSGDAWVFARAGGSRSALAAPGLANYGASQAGAVLRYALAPDTAARPELYGRIVAALQAPTQRDVALGVSAQPAAGLPLRLHAEARVTRQPGRGQQDTLLRPAVFATAGLYQQDSQRDLTMRGYAQAGYVGGRPATAFLDAQIVGERTVARFDLGETALGAGAWGGVQRGAGRLDIGPSASLTIRPGRSPVRLSADYRVRIAGIAEPGSGAAVTLSTGF